MAIEEDKIIEALRNQQWDYRTAEGIAKEIGLPVDTVRAFLESRKDIVWKSSIPDRRGRDLYTLIERHPQSKDFWRNISTFISKSSS
jgi:hypothetical protein